MQKRLEQAGTKKGQRGSILATSAIGMLSVLLAVGLGLDISRLYLTKAELQNAADAAALAGVSALNGDGPGITKAVDRAVDVVKNSYNFNKTSVPFSRSNVTFAVNLDGPYISEASAFTSPTNIRFVKVTTPNAAIPMSFASFVLGKNRNLAAEATAGFSVPINVICPWLPAFVLDNPADPIKSGGTYTFRLEPGTTVSPGNYQLLAPIQSGGSGDREGMANGVRWCIPVGTEVKTKPGVTAGAIRQGINSRFDQYSGGLDPAISPPDDNIAENITKSDYDKKIGAKAPPNHPGIPGRRIVFIPIAKELPGSGRDTIVVYKFGVFFLQTSVGGGNGGELKAEYITDTAFAGDSYYDPGAGAVNDNLAVPVLYK